MAEAKILVIEDEPYIRQILKVQLESAGYGVATAENGQQGLNAIKADRPDLVLLDLMMPDMDGWEVYQQIKADEILREIPVVVVTAKAQSIDKVLGLHIAKVDDYITKPFGPQELLESVEKLIGVED